MTPSSSPQRCRFSAVCTPSGNGASCNASYTRGPRKPISTRGWAMVTWSNDPHDANTPPVVGWRRYTRYGRAAALCAVIAALILTICKNAVVPSCMRVPPDAVVASSGSPSAVARSTAMTSRSAAATPMEPARKLNSQPIKATGRPCTSPLPVSTDSSRPERSRARVSVAAYASLVGTCTRGSSQETKEPPSTTVSSSCSTLGRSASSLIAPIIAGPPVRE